MYSYNVNPGMPPPPPEGRLGTMIYPVYPCKDGFIRVVALTPRQWDGLVHVLGDPEVLKQPQWREFYYRIRQCCRYIRRYAGIHHAVHDAGTLREGTPGGRADCPYLQY